ncbi:hypothetical protein E2C01_045078 [Portunus trituberculatus]|uniref:Uncharacterized protein n=1 Tax=Portunus trituberculatus TaxID=210409 RepID=A0A5B7G430_PORTR|nr:hypothetical protein [Portunus trituberculatus]
MEPESMEVDSTKDNRLEPEEKQDSAVEKETTEEDHSTAAESDEQCDMSSAGVGVVIMDGDLTPSEIIDIDKSVSEQQCSEGNDIQDQEGNNDEQANPLSTADEQENTDKPELEADAVEMSSAEESNSEGNCLVSKVTENDTSLDKQSVVSNDDENVDKNQKKKQNKECNDDLSVMEDKAASNESKKIKLRSLASLVDVAGGDDVPHPDIPGIGEIVEHGVIIGSEEMDGLQLRISNVVGGEDCITGLTVDEDRDAFSSIQISSVTTLIDPISPEDPNQIDNSDENHMVDEENEKEIEENLPCRLVSSTSTAEPQSSSAGTAASDSVDLTKDDGKKSAEKNDDSSETEKSSNRKDLTDSGSAGPKIRLSTAATEVGKDAGSKDESSPPRHVYHILRSILTVKRECVLCSRNVQCQFRIVKKDENGTWAFLCSTSCRAKWTSGLMPNHVVEKPRLIFEKLCGMCGKDLASLARDGQYSWETREFCSKDCLSKSLFLIFRKYMRRTATE